MRRFLAAFVLGVAIGLLYNTASARDVVLRKLATVELQRDSLVQNDSMRTIELIGPRRMLLGSFQSVRLYDILAGLPGLDSLQRTSLTVVCEASDGTTCTSSFAELDPAFVKLPPLLLLNANVDTEKKLDSFSLADKKGSRGKVDLATFEKRFGSVTRLRYTMNDVELSAEERRQFGALTMRVLFPYDRSAMRWLPDVKFIHVYIAE